MILLYIFICPTEKDEIEHLNQSLKAEKLCSDSSQLSIDT